MRTRRRLEVQEVQLMINIHTLRPETVTAIAVSWALAVSKKTCESAPVAYGSPYLAHRHRRSICMRL